MNIPKNPKAIALLNLYKFHQTTSAYCRSELKKQIRKYNKANPSEAIQPAMLIKTHFPTYFKYISSKYPEVPESELFERNFTKLAFNLHILPSRKSYTFSASQKTRLIYDSMSYSDIAVAYNHNNKAVVFINELTNNTYTLDTMYTLKSSDGSDSLSIYQPPYVLFFFKEV